MSGTAVATPSPAMSQKWPGPSVTVVSSPACANSTLPTTNTGISTTVSAVIAVTACTGEGKRFFTKP